AGCQVREQIADPLAALAVLLEFPLGTDDSPLILVAAAAERLYRDGLAVQRVEVGFVIEGIDMAGTAVHEEEDHALGLGRVRRFLRGRRIAELRRSLCSTC